MLLKAIICVLGLTLLLTAAEPTRRPAQNQAREFFFRDFYLDPWQIPEADPNHLNVAQNAPESSPDDPALTLTKPGAPVPSVPQQPSQPFPAGTILLLALAVLLAIKASILPLRQSGKSTPLFTRFTTRYMIRRLQKKYHQHEHTPEFRQALKETLRLPPGATDQDIAQALQDCCNQELSAIIRDGHNRFR